MTCGATAVTEKSGRWRICLLYTSAMIGAGIYYMTWVLKNKNLFGQFAWAAIIPLIIALIFTPTLVGKWKGMYKLNLRGYVLAVIGRAPVSYTHLSILWLRSDIS